MPYRLGVDRGPEEPAVGDISRRNLLRKGALLGGSVLWVAPVVQTIGIGQAFAQTELVSPGGERCLRIELTPTGPDLTPLPGWPNKYRYDMEVCNCGDLLITDIFVTCKVISLAVNGGASSDPGITWITSNNVGNLQQINDSGLLDCYTQHTDQDIKTSFGVSSGDTVVYKVRVTATDSFGPVSDEQTYSAVIA